MDTAAPLRAFRDRLYASLGRRADALFELSDAIIHATASGQRLPWENREGVEPYCEDLGGFARIADG